jgi:hypothetical protein
VPHTGESTGAAVVCLALERADVDRPDVLRDAAAATGISTVTIKQSVQVAAPARRAALRLKDGRAIVVYETTSLSDLL